MARYLITGIAGFIGSTLACELVARGEEVRGLDNLSSGSLTNLRTVEDRIEFLHADLRSDAALDLACQGVDFVFHLAAIDSVQQSIEDPLGTASVNVDGTLRLIAAAQRNQVKRVVFASSSAVYGDGAECPVSETLTPNPLTPYAVQKLSCEQYLANAGALSGMETVSLRLFNVFGPRQSANAPDARVIARFVGDMLPDLEGGAIIHGDGEQTRDFVFVSDVACACLLAMKAPAEKASGKVFNVGSGRPTTIGMAFETIACLCSYSGVPRFVHDRPGDIRQSVASIAAAQQAFGYKPAVSFAEGLHKTVSWHRDRLSGAPEAEEGGQRKFQRTRLAAATAPVPPSAERHINAQTFAEAVQNNELELFYLPILDLAESRIVGVEALLRWRLAHRLLAPSHFMHLAEQKGLTPLIGAWVLDQACADTVRFQRELGVDLRLAVNVASSHLEQRSFLKTVETALSASGLGAKHLDLEVTERTLVSECANVQQNLSLLRRRGVRIAVDDFGNGYSNISYLYRFPVDCLKIDQSFVQHKGHTRVLHGIVAFAKTIGVRTVAEGVESARQLSHVKSAECDEAQGFYIGRPAPASHFVQAVIEHDKPLRQLGGSKAGPMLSLPMPLVQTPRETGDEAL